MTQASQLQPKPVERAMPETPALDVVIFGASGDLARRKVLPALGGARP